MATIAVEPGRVEVPGGPAPNVARRSRRIASLDIARGSVMVLMAIDHVRVYAGVPAGGPNPAVFFTRWVTHFCAPIFFFLAGTAAYLYGQKVQSKPALATFLITRGLFLVLLELTILRFGWTFNFDYANFTFAGVIWALGWCMVLLGALIFLPTRAVAAIGLAIIIGHNAIGPALTGGESPSWIAQILYAGGGFTLPGTGWQLAILYVLVPWIGVMAAGYGFGAVMRSAPDVRRRACLSVGAVAVALFVALRWTGVYGDPRPWRPRPAAAAPAAGGQATAQAPGTASPPAGAVAATPPAGAQAAPPAAASNLAGGSPQAAPPQEAPRRQLSPALSFLNTAKYPASLLFLLMTLGPLLLALPFLERAGGRVVRWLEVFGRVPFFYYILHIPLIHLVAVLISLVRTPQNTGWLIANHPLAPPPVPQGYVWSLALLYLVTALVVVALYFPCRWYAKLKEDRGGRGLLSLI